MSARRAAIRKERLQREKAKKSKTMLGKLERAKQKGILDGRVIASSVILEVLHSKYRLSNQKAQKVLDCTMKESVKADQQGTNFVLNFYAEKLSKKIDAVDVYQDMNDIETQVYCVGRYNLFVSTAAVMFAALNELYGFSSNNKGTGRLDYIMEYCVNRYIEIQLDPGHKTADYYFQKMRRNTGYKLK